MSEAWFRLYRNLPKAISVFAILFSNTVSADEFLHSNSCAQDGLCTLISVEHEVSVLQPNVTAGAVIGVIDDDGFRSSPVNIQAAKKKCRKEVRVPKVVQRAVLKMFESVAQRGGAAALPAQLTPAEQTMLLYYNTIMQQTMNSSCEK